MIKKYFLKLFLLTFCLFPTSCDQLQELGITNEEVVSGLKEALNQGAKVASQNLGVTDGYFKDQAVKILLPPDALTMIEKAYAVPGAQTILEPYLATVVEKMNRGAEKAATKAVPIFADAISSMSINDAMNILKGNDTAATGYLRLTTYQPLTNAFAPEINAAMDEVGATSAWNSLFSEYNSYVNSTTTLLFGLQTINPNLGEYATEKALNGLFLKVGNEEKGIRNDISKRGSDLLKKVFKEQD